MTAIEMARECMKNTSATMQEALLFTSGDSAFVGTAMESYNERLLLAMHAMRQAEIDAKAAEIAELVDGLRAAVQVLQCIEPQPNISAQGIGLTALITKHRPDAFAK